MMPVRNEYGSSATGRYVFHTRYECPEWGTVFAVFVYKNNPSGQKCYCGPLKLLARADTDAGVSHPLHYANRER